MILRYFSTEPGLGSWVPRELHGRGRKHPDFTLLASVRRPTSVVWHTNRAPRADHRHGGVCGSSDPLHQSSVYPTPTLSLTYHIGPWKLQERWKTEKKKASGSSLVVVSPLCVSTNIRMRTQHISCLCTSCTMDIIFLWFDALIIPQEQFQGTVHWREMHRTKWLSFHLLTWPRSFLGAEICPFCDLINCPLGQSIIMVSSSSAGKLKYLLLDRYLWQSSWRGTGAVASRLLLPKRSYKMDRFSRWHWIHPQISVVCETVSEVVSSWLQE